MVSWLSSSRTNLSWVVTLGERRYVVQVHWPGFDNWIAVDGVVVHRWRWPGNNLYTWKTFEVGGVPCKLIRQRTGLLDYAFELRASTVAHVERVAGD